MTAIKRPTFKPSWTHLLMWAAILAGLFWFLGAVRPILLPFVVGMLMAYLFDPVADRMERRGMNRTLAAGIITLGFFAVIVAVIVWLAPLLYTQLAELIAKIPGMLSQAESLLRETLSPFIRSINRVTDGTGAEPIPSNPHALIGRATELASNFVLGLLASSAAVLNIVSMLLITPIVSFYLLRDWDRMVAEVNKLLPRAYAPTIRTQCGEINKTLAGYLRGQLYVMGILATYYVIALSLCGLNYALLIGVMAGTFVIVPYIGTWISAGTGLILAYGQYDTTTGFWAVVAIFCAGQILEQQVLTPKVIGERVGLHPLWLLFGMLAGAVFFGFVGILLAVPLTAIISVLVRFIIALYLESSLYKDP